MSKKSKRLKAVDRKRKRRAEKEARKKEFLNKILAGVNSKSRQKRLSRNAKMERLVRTRDRSKEGYVPPSKFWKEFWNAKAA